MGGGFDVMGAAMMKFLTEALLFVFMATGVRLYAMEK
jgi:hypothetical protein